MAEYILYSQEIHAVIPPDAWDEAYFSLLSLKHALAGVPGWKRLDFFGLIPAYLYKNCTSVFFRDDRWVTGGPLPCDVVSEVGQTCAGALGE